MVNPRISTTFLKATKKFRPTTFAKLHYKLYYCKPNLRKTDKTDTFTSENLIHNEQKHIEHIL